MLSKYTLNVANCLFRMMLITMFWENEFQPMPLMRVSLSARELYAKATNGYGHKNALLNACIKIQDPSFRHSIDKDIIDYPPLPAHSPARVAKLLDAQEFWKTEMNHDFAKQTTDNKAAAAIKRRFKQEMSAQHLIEKNKMIEQIYAFGYRIVETITVPTDL